MTPYSADLVEELYLRSSECPLYYMAANMIRDDRATIDVLEAARSRLIEDRAGILRLLAAARARNAELEAENATLHTWAVKVTELDAQLVTAEAQLDKWQEKAENAITATVKANRRAAAAEAKLAELYGDYPATRPRTPSESTP